MAITMRIGTYDKFDPRKMVAGEYAVVTSGDPDTSDGKAIYMCFSPGDVKKLSTYEDFVAFQETVKDEIADYKELLETIGNTATEASSTAKKALKQASDNENEVSAFGNVIDNFGTRLDSVESDLTGYCQELEVDDQGLVYLLNNGERIAGPYGPFAGGGGGSGSGNNAVLTMTNTTGWLATTIASGSACALKVSWSSLENETPTGDGTLTVKVNNVTKTTKNVNQGEITIDVKDFLSSGANRIKLSISDVYGNTRTISFSISVVEISLSSNFDSSVVYTDDIMYTYVPTGAIEKTMHFVLDGTELDTAATSVSGRQQSYVIPKQTHGTHILLVYFTCTIDGNEVRSNELYYELICTVAGNMHPVIASNYVGGEIVQYTSVPVTYRVYDPAGMTTEVKLYAGDTLVSTQTVDRTEQTWTYRADNVGSLILRIDVNNGYATASKSWTFTVTESSVDVSAETENLSLFLSSYGRSNNEENPGTWSYGNIAATFTNFNFASDGWQKDKDNISVLRVAGDARLTIPLKIFEKDFRTTGKTIEFEFSTSEVMDYDAVILSCMSGNRGVQLTAQKAILKSEQSEIFTQYKEDEHVRIAFVVEKRSENRLIYVYINGNMSGSIQYPADDDFSQQTPVDISIGSNDCVINLYCIRVYDNDLTRHQMLDNWIADSQNVDDLLYRYQHNNVFNEYGSIVIQKLPGDLPYLVITSAELPTYKGDKKKVSGYYVDPQYPEFSFSFENAEIDVQGTSSAGYERKNFKIKFKGGFVINGKQTAQYAMRGDTRSIPTATFTCKADVASSEGANNVELVRLYNDICPYKTPPQAEDPRIRQGIDGFPIVMFQDDGQNVTFIGKYNFNNDKGTENVYGFSDGDESWEILNNTSSRVNWKSADFTGEEWLNDFEGRYPDGNTDPANLSTLSSWIVSTDQSTATNEALSASVAYDGVTYDKDTAAYRLAKFKNEAADHFEMNDLLFYYMFTELFLLVDSRAKNAFPTFFDGHKWIWFPYDMDTAIGINNEGALVFDYSLEDIDTVEGANVFNGQESVLWVNVRAAFHDEIAALYQTLRSGGKLSYAAVEQQFEDHQAKWPEAIYNEDAWYKYLAPLVEKGNAAYLSMLQGSKAEQRKWWLYNRFRYIDSKYNAGDALADFVMLRAYAKGDITVTPYADIYASIKYASYLVQKRALRGASYTLECPLDAFNDTEIYIYSSSQLKSVGDLSALMVGYADFSQATRLQSLKLGDSATTYSNTNLTSLTLGNNILLKTLDVRNCPNLTQTVDLSGCSNLEHVYFDGTSIPSVNLPAGGIMKTLHLPETVTNLTIINQKGITDFVMPTYANITTLRLENVGDLVDSQAILEAIQTNSRVRLIGINWQCDSIEDALALCTILDGMRGLDENGNNMDTAQVSGTIHVPTLTGAQMADIQSRYPSITVTYDHITSYCYFYNYDGSTLLYTATCTDASDAVYGGSTPTRTSTAQYSYTFAGWGLMPNGSVNPDALKNVSADRKVYAIMTATIRKYTVYFYNGSTVLQTVSNVPYGGSATYTGTTPVSPDGSADDYPFEGWNPEPKNITGNTYCYAKFGSPLEVKEIEDSWDEIIAACSDGTYATKYKIGNYKPLDLGSEGIVNMQIAGKDVDELADGSGMAKLSWISKELLNTPHRFNPYAKYTYVKEGDESWELSESGGTYLAYTTNNAYCLSTAKMTITIQTVIAQQFTINLFNSQTNNEINLTISEHEYTFDEDNDKYFIDCKANESFTVTAEFTCNLEDTYSYAKLNIRCTQNIERITKTITIEKCLVRKQIFTEGTGMTGGWEKTELRSYINTNIWNLIPANVQSKIAEIKNEQRALDNRAKAFTQITTDKLFIPRSFDELSNKYKTLFGTKANKESKKKAKIDGIVKEWWLRDCSNNSSAKIITISGGTYEKAASDSICIALGFCF